MEDARKVHMYPEKILLRDKHVCIVVTLFTPVRNVNVENLVYLKAHVAWFKRSNSILLHFLTELQPNHPIMAKCQNECSLMQNVYSVINKIANLRFFLPQ